MQACICISKTFTPQIKQNSSICYSYMTVGVGYLCYYIHPSSGILYNQFLIDMDSCSDVVGYFYDAAPGRIYMNWQGKLV